MRDTHDAAFYSVIGKKGGEAVKAKHDRDYYARIGRIGGSKRGILKESDVNEHHTQSGTLPNNGTLKD